MTIEELRTEMQAGFKKVDDEFVGVRAEFVAVRAEFVGVRAEFVAVRSEISAQGETIRRHVDAQIRAEGEATRRHFDIVAEDMKDLIRVVAEATAQNTQRLNDHEKILTELKKPRI